MVSSEKMMQGASHLDPMLIKQGAPHLDSFVFVSGFSGKEPTVAAFIVSLTKRMRLSYGFLKRNLQSERCDSVAF